MVEKNPCLKVSLLPERNVRDRIASPEEFDKLKKEIPHYNLILSIGYYLPMREGKILNLREKQVHFFDDDSNEGFIYSTMKRQRAGKEGKFPSERRLEVF